MHSVNPPQNEFVPTARDVWPSEPIRHILLFTHPTGPNMVSSASPISKDTATHYEWGQGCDGWHLVRTAGLGIIEERMPPGTSEVRHWHARARQFFYVVAGTLSMEVEGERHELAARTGIELAPGLAHQATNDSDGDVEFIVVSIPPSHGDRHEA